VNPFFIHVTFIAIVPGAYSGRPRCAYRRQYLVTYLLQLELLIVAGTEGQQPPPLTSSAADATLSVLSPCSEEVRRLIMQSPTKSCALDPITIFLLKEMVDVLLPYVTVMVNTSLREGRLLSSVTQARRSHPAAKEDRTGRRRAEKLQTSLQFDICVKTGGETREWSPRGSSPTSMHMV